MLDAMQHDPWDLRVLRETLEGLGLLLPKRIVDLILALVALALWLALTVILWHFSPTLGALVGANSLGAGLVYFWRRRQGA
jgi:hypothetical protein